MTITISHNEIIVACLKAFEALGMNQGQREDVAQAIGWLALHGQPFEERLKCAISQFDLKLSVPHLVTQTAEMSAWNAHGASALHIFPLLVDFACAQEGKVAQYQLSILNMPDLDLMWPYLAKAAERGHYCSLRWKVAEEVGRRIIFDVDKPPTLYWLTITDPTFNLGDVHLEMIQPGACQAGRGAEAQALRIESGSALQSHRQKQTRNGILIDESFWYQLVEIGKGILVESTEESEQRGAGGI